MEVAPQYQMDPAALGMLYVRSSTGQLAPLYSLATLQKGLGPLSVNHLGQITSVTLSFNLKPGTPLGDAVAAVEKEARALPATITTGFQGTAQVYQASTKGLAALLSLAMVGIYIVLGILYKLHSSSLYYRSSGCEASAR
jgi:HAE1 family hydrophobic/amphiphilic exporter-1